MELELAAKGVSELFRWGILGVLLGLSLMAIYWFTKMLRKDLEQMHETHREERKELVQTIKTQAEDYKKSIETIFADNKQMMVSFNFGIESLKDRMSTNCPRFKTSD